VKLTTHLQLVPRSRKSGPIHPLPPPPSWHSAELVKHRDNFILKWMLKKQRWIARAGSILRISDKQDLVNTVMNLQASITYYETGCLDADHLESK
jgi:hypothetical protein